MIHWETPVARRLLAGIICRAASFRSLKTPVLNDTCSPKGGQPPIDPEERTCPKINNSDAMSRFKKDSAAQEALSQTIKLGDAKSEDYATTSMSEGMAHVASVSYPS